jgi:dTDP-4-amino-4,6-dideoxygalactose transaminase
MRKRGVQATFHYQPLHSSDAGRAFAARDTRCPVSQQVSERLLRLPFYNDLGGRDLERVTATFLDVTSAILADR